MQLAPNKPPTAKCQQLYYYLNYLRSSCLPWLGGASCEFIIGCLGEWNPRIRQHPHTAEFPGARSCALMRDREEEFTEDRKI